MDFEPRNRVLEQGMEEMFRVQYGTCVISKPVTTTDPQTVTPYKTK